jgi:hypothetical protein
MTLLTDGRKWLSAELAEPSKFDSLLLTMIGQSSDGTVTVVGNAFIIYANGRDALCLTAAHNFEFLKSLSKAGSLQSHPTLPRDFEFRGTQYIKTDGCTAMWTYQDRPYICKLTKINYIENYDVAVFTARSEETAPPFSGRLALDLRMPRLGDEVAVLAHRLDYEAFSDGGGSLQRSLLFRLGTVSESTTSADRMKQTFSFETTIPIMPGLSGSPIVVMPEIGKPLTVCGVVSSDSSLSEAFESTSIAGQSRGAALWPCAGLGFEMEIEAKGPTVALIADLIAGNFLQVRSDHIEVSATYRGARLHIFYSDLDSEPPQRILLETTGHPLYLRAST